MRNGHVAGPSESIGRLFEVHRGPHNMAPQAPCCCLSIRTYIPIPIRARAKRVLNACPSANRDTRGTDAGTVGDRTG